MSVAPFVPLRVFSSYTMLEGAIEPKAIAKQVKKLGSPAAAIVDRNGLYGVMGFSDAAKSEGIQPIIGTLLAVARPADIGPDNVIRSDRLGQLEVRVNGKGVVGDAINRPFFLYRLLLGLLPF